MAVWIGGCGGWQLFHFRQIHGSLDGGWGGGVAVISFLIDTGQFGLAPPAISFCTAARERLLAEMGIRLRLSSAVVRL